TAGIPEALLADYERRAQRTAGAALLRGGMCEGCRMMLSGTDMNQVRQAHEDAVLSCPECGCILVRTEESGLCTSAHCSGRAHCAWVGAMAAVERRILLIGGIRGPIETVELDDDDRAIARQRLDGPDLHAWVREQERTGQVRWVVRNATTLHRRLSAEGVTLTRVHD